MSRAAETASDKIESNRGTLEDLAESELPCADVAAALLEVCDE